jgi:hypothetical protein
MRMPYAEAMPDSHDAAEPAPVPDYSEDGVDLTLIRWTLSLTPAERLAFLEQRIADVLSIRALNANNESV